MATAISFPRAPLVTPRACTPRRLVHVSAARASPPRGGGRVGRRSPTVPAVAGASSSSSGLAPDTSVPAWDALGGVSVLAAGTGNAVALTDLWDSAEGVAVVALLRHFGCFCCWELASVLKDAMAEFDSAGAKLIAIGVGTPEKARILADRGWIFCVQKQRTVECKERRGRTGDRAPLDDVLNICCEVPAA
uniref:Thioredoxin superfamily protein n=1 Tax=Zea mays TaxID=4577 RepID=A0A804M3A6_MAIZE